MTAVERQNGLSLMTLGFRHLKRICSMIIGHEEERENDTREFTCPLTVYQASTNDVLPTIIALVRCGETSHARPFLP